MVIIVDNYDLKLRKKRIKILPTYDFNKLLKEEKINV